MPDLPVPAPLWRRLIAATYDGLLLLGLWMGAALLDVIVRDLIQLPRDVLSFRIFLFLIGLVFFGWFWTHGGQTLGMRAWRLQVRREDGAPLLWPIAALRYAAAFVSWGCVGIGMLWCLLDRKRRAWHDLASGTEVIVLPKFSAPSTGGTGQSPTGPM
jgi:uncharacterized RDD family membrane protein YckC